MVFGRYMIIPINYVVDWRYICQHKHAQIDKYIIRGNTTRIDHNYRAGDKVMTLTKSSYKYKTPFRGLYGIFHTWTNGSVILRTSSVKMRINICNVKPYNIPIVEGRNTTQEV